MPNVTFFMPANAMPAHDHLAALTERSAELCLALLQAAPRTVHVIHVPVLHGCGQPAFARIDYRLEPCRTPAVMDRFMAALDEAITQTTGHTARIRCFGHAAAALHARN